VKETLFIEIPVEITFSIDPGQKGRFSGRPDDCCPEYPAMVEDKTFNFEEVLSAVIEKIYGLDSTIDEELMAIATWRKEGEEK